MIDFILTQTPLAFFIQSFWRDEAFSYILASRNIFEIIFYTARDFNPPLYYILLHYWMGIFGTSEIAIRSLSLLFFSLTLYICFEFLKDILKLSDKKSLLYLFIFLINPLLVYFAFEARMYSMFTFFSVLSYYSFYSNKSKLYIISTILGLYTHYIMVLVVLSQLAFYFVIDRKRQNKTKLKYAYAALFIFIPWVLFVFSQGQFFTTSFWIERMRINTFVNLFAILYLGYEQGSRFFSKELQFLTLFFASLFIITILKLKNEMGEKRKLFLFLGIWSIGSSLLIGFISFFKPLFIPRYLIFSSVGFIFLTIFMLEELPLRIRWIALIILIFFTLNFQKLQIQQKRKSEVRKTIDEIKLVAKKNDLIYVSDELDYFTVQYYLGEDRVFIYNKTYDEIPQFVGKALIPKEKIASALPSYPQKAFVLSRNGTYVIQSLY